MLFVHHVTPFASHRQTYAPAVLRGHGDRFIRDVIAVNNQNRDFGQCHKLRHRAPGSPFSVSNALGIGQGVLFREDKAATGLEGDNGFDLVIFIAVYQLVRHPESG